MKKFLFALVCFAAMLFAGCKGGNDNNPLKDGTKASELTKEQIEKLDNTTEKCWHVVETITVSTYTETEEWYDWCTEQEIAKAVKLAYDLEKIGQYEIAYKEASANDDAACKKLDDAVRGGEDDNNPSGGGVKQCWEIWYNASVVYPHYTLLYVWYTEEEVNFYIASLKANTGVDYQASKVDAANKDACENKEIVNTPYNDQGEKFCWKMVRSFEEDNTTVTETWYVWGSETYIQGVIDAHKAAGINIISCDKVEGVEDQDACDELDANA